MTYLEMVNSLSNMSDESRLKSILEHWQTVFSDGFIGYVQGQLEWTQEMLPIVKEIHPEAVTQFSLLKTNLTLVWKSMVSIYEELQRQSENQGNSKGMVAHGKHRVMPRGVNVNVAVHCYKCGASAVSEGLCINCNAVKEQENQEFINRDQQSYYDQQDHIEYHRIQDEHLYHNNQQDFNTYNDY